MEGSSNPGGNESVEELQTSTFTWRIENFSTLNVKKKYSETFVVGGYQWRILVFPKGNGCDYFAAYLDVPDSAGLEYGWSRYAQFGISVISQIHTRYTIRKDLQLDVKGCRDVYAALDKYVEKECLKGDNKYHAGSYGLQDAKKGLLFIDLPPILPIHLKRFEYDFIRDTMVKLNDYFEFPLELDLDIEGGKYLLPEAGRGDKNLYTLHSVLVHSGGVHGGHYSAFIRPNLSHQWYKFDDERVTKVDAKEALEEQYGSKELLQTNSGLNDYQKCSNAYMLESLQSDDGQKEQNKKDEEYLTVKVRLFILPFNEEHVCIANHKLAFFTEELYDKHSQVAIDEDITQHRGLDLVDHDKVKSFHIQRQEPFQLLKEKVASEFGVPVKCQRFWLWTKHQNHTLRLNGPLTHVEDAQTVTFCLLLSTSTADRLYCFTLIGQLKEASNNTFDGVLKLFLEVELGSDLHPIPPPNKTEDDILLFFKLYDPEIEELRIVGRLFVKSTSKPTDIFAKLNAMVGYAPDEEIELYEEMKFGANVACERIEPNSTFQSTKVIVKNLYPN
ncbi:ubiquitin carboxyl-terminal hydrolase 12-like [Olea europaea subsp. europaea]|uniref:Ubiquitin carboxyl-terminal hydrolase 12-like n=1 Tax=Olea europaea subsp. europaea TaxID=158383 RepID=A0A8S0PEK7_OLEEU|nr:ubiquitin carboxyl-terminal hydrolase 12-like [Olea europaea subsp. europaea]